MTDTLKLNQFIALSGLKKKYIADQLDLTYYGLHKKIKNESEFTAAEINGLCNLLGIKTLREKEEIFFAK